MQLSVNISQTEHFSVVKFAMGYDLMIAKSPKVWKKVEKIELGSFKGRSWKVHKQLCVLINSKVNLLLRLKIHLNAS